MSYYGITNDFASATKTSKDTILLTPHNQYLGTELNDEKFEKLYAMYLGLLLMQYNEDCKNN